MKLSQETKEKLIVALTPRCLELLEQLNLPHVSLGGFVKGYVDDIEDAFLTVDEN